MSVGRHARKRAAKQAEEITIKENKLLDEQDALLQKEEAKKGAMEKDIEGQRIATMRARFGGQVPEQTAGTGGGQSVASTAETGSGSKNSTPKTLTGKTKNVDPMRQTIMAMMLDNNDGAM